MFKKTRSRMIVVAALALIAWLSSWPVVWAGGFSQTVPTRTPTPGPGTTVAVTQPSPKATHQPPLPTRLGIQPTQPVVEISPTSARKPRTPGEPSRTAERPTITPTSPAHTPSPLPRPTITVTTLAVATASQLTSTPVLTPSPAATTIATPTTVILSQTFPTATSPSPPQPGALPTQWVTSTPHPDVPAATSGVSGGICAATSAVLLLLVAWLATQANRRRSLAHDE